MIFLTGGTGMLGAHLLLDLTKSGIPVRALKRKNSDLPAVKKIFYWYTADADKLFAQIEWVEGDLMDKNSLREAIKGADTIIHAAAKVSFDPRDRETMLHENVEGTANLVDLALELNIQRFCQVSSVSALGNQDFGIPVNEDLSWKNDSRRSAYSESKFQSEMEVWRGIEEELQAVIVNPSVILGPGKWESGSPRFFQTIAKGMKFYTDGSTGFVDVRDVSLAIIGLLQSENWESIKNQRYVISGENLTFREVFDGIAVALNQQKPTIRANRILLQLGWRASLLVSLITRKDPALTKETARSAGKHSKYDGSKITRTIDFGYTPIAKTIQDIGKIFLEEHK
ncbi:MAG: NAD-dependent epimerase/dehydratase family protein [Prolixibacteraceae bacterium]